MIPVTKKLHRQPKRNKITPRNGIPIAVENFAAESVIAVARLLSFSGNQYPSALALPGNTGDSPIPRRKRASRKLTTPVEAAAANEAKLHNREPIRPTRRTPQRSSSAPAGICMRAYVQLYALERYPKVTREIPKEACRASCETERFTRSRKATKTPSDNRKAILHRRAGTRLTGSFIAII